MILPLAVLASGARATSVELTTYGYGNARLGTSPGPVGISTRGASRLHAVWRATLGGAIDGQALIVNRVRIHHRLRDVVLAATEHGRVAALDARTGRILWSRHVGSHRIQPRCQASPDGYFGVTGAMVADKLSNRLYAVDVNGLAWALDLSTGRVVKGWPVRVHPRGADFDWGALTLSQGRLYVPVASLCTVGRYYGGITAVDVTDPKHVIRWLTITSKHVYDGSIWGWGGVSVDNRTGDVFAATGNALGTRDEHTGLAEHVIRFSPTLQLEQSNYPLRPPFLTDDRDFGTTPVLIRAAGCPLQAVAINKDGFMYRYSADDISAGPRQHIAVARTTNGTIPLYGMPVYDPASRRLVLTSPTTPFGGRLRAGIESFLLTHKCKLVPSWQHKFDKPDAGSAPTIAQGVLYIGSGRNGILRVYRLRDGRELSYHALGTTSFAAPAIADGTVVVGDWRGHLWAFRPR